METINSLNMIVNNGGVFDLQSALGKMPWFIWSKYKTEHHCPRYSFLGPSIALNIGLDKNDIRRLGDKLVSATDELALHHDIAY